jgi:hypothetical protein
MSPPDQPKQAHVESTDPSPHSFGEFIRASVDPFQQYRIADAASHDLLYLFKHPQDMAIGPIPGLILAEDAALRGIHAAVDLGVVTPYHMLQDGTNAAKDIIDGGKNLLDLPLDIIGLRPGEAVQDAINVVKAPVNAVVDVAKATVVDPAKGVWDALKDIF